MIRLRVERSPVRQFLAGLAGLVLILAAFDVMFFYWLSSPPTTNEDGIRTSRGITERRTDLLWGSVLFVGGAVVLAGAGAALLIHRPVVELTDEELRLRVGGPGRPGPLGTVSIPWSQVVSVRSSTDGGDDWQPTRVLIVEVTDRELLPQGPWGADWVGDELHLDADGWQVPPEEIAMQAERLVRRHGGSGNGDGEEA